MIIVTNLNNNGNIYDVNNLGGIMMGKQIPTEKQIDNINHFAGDVVHLLKTHFEKTHINSVVPIGSVSVSFTANDFYKYCKNERVPLPILYCLVAELEAYTNCTVEFTRWNGHFKCTWNAPVRIKFNSLKELEQANHKK